MAFEFAYQLDGNASPSVKKFNCAEADGVSRGDLLKLVDGEVELATVGGGNLIGFALNDADEDENVSVIVARDTVMRVPYSGTTKTTLTTADIGTFFNINDTADELDLDATGGNLYLVGYDDSRDTSVAFVMIKDQSVVGVASKFMKINMTASDFSDDSEVDTNVELPDSSIVKRVFLNVNTAESTASTKTIDVGTDNDSDGFLVGASVASTGLVAGAVDLTDVDSAGTTIGELLLETNTTNDTAVNILDTTSGGDSITVTADDAGGFDEADFDIIIEYIEVA